MLGPDDPLTVLDVAENGIHTKIPALTSVVNVQHKRTWTASGPDKELRSTVFNNLRLIDASCGR